MSPYKFGPEGVAPMDTNKLLELVRQYSENNQFITNEETAKLSLVVPFIRALGFEPNNPKEVRLEFTAEFTQGDGKRFADRMDFAIFDKNGLKPLLVIETKPLGTDLRSKAQQLARYIAQMPDLRFGIISDGCDYLFYGDLEKPNVMDKNPFFCFSLNDEKTDWTKVAKFLNKFSRDAFNADTLITDAENSRYRQEMIQKIATALKAPQNDAAFLNWLTEGIYKGKRTSSIMSRLGEVAREAVEPALLKVISDDFVDRLKENIQSLKSTEEDSGAESSDAGLDNSQLDVEACDTEVEFENQKPGIETTDEELEFHRLVQDICVREGATAEDILFKDTRNYFNVSYQRPTRWFLRYFGRTGRKGIISPVPIEEARSLVPGFEVEEAPSVFGVSRVYVDNVSQVWALQELVKRSLAQVSEDKRN